MNQEAERHLDKAAGYLAKGDGWYEKAADEIIAAKAADFSLSNRAIGERFGRSQKWVGDIVRWRTSGSDLPTPFAFDSSDRPVRAARQILRTAPMEQVEQIVAALPPERQQQIAAAAGSSYHRARVERDEADRRRTDAERREQEQAGEQLARPARQVSGDFASLGIVGHIEQATEELNELSSDASLTPQALRRIERADERWRSTLDFARALVGEEVDR